MEDENPDFVAFIRRARTRWDSNALEASRTSPLIHPRFEPARQEDSPFKRMGIGNRKCLDCLPQAIFTRPRDVEVTRSK
jgi:hypothetical protein